MAKYDWHNLEKEYILSDYKSVSAFLKDKNIPRSGSVQKAVRGWNRKKVQKEFEQSSKTIQKVIEKQAEENASKAVTVNEVANELLSKILIASSELNKNTDLFGNIHNDEILNRADIKKLTSALKDIRDILGNNQDNSNQRIQIINDLPGDDNET